MRKQLIIKCDNKAEKYAAVTLLYGFGHKARGYDTANDFLRTYGNSAGHPNVLLASRDNSVDLIAPSFIGTHDSVVLKFSDTIKLIDFLQGNKEPVKVKLTDDYTADVYPTHIQVGCQKITLEVFDELATAVRKTRS